ncbi:MAG: hypothetical protein Greene041619_627 [Candidatus Peregrinibacteria bacterium Greene0416_19]|nr:MAG: hypothetical protein Greene041619_627 [Candidatus Peregrinibacteria bacterium Greene0416_19]
MNETDDLLRAIANDPTNKDLRLSYAATLEDTGGPHARRRAECIRVQYAVQACRDLYISESHPGFQELLLRETELLVHAKQWLTPETRDLARSNCSYSWGGEKDYAQFRRGFVEHIAPRDLRALPRLLPALLEQWPILSLTCSVWNKQEARDVLQRKGDFHKQMIAALDALPENRFRELGLWFAEPATIERMLPKSGNLETLILYSPFPGALREIAKAAAQLPALKALQIRHAWPVDGSTAALRRELLECSETVLAEQLEEWSVAHLDSPGVLLDCLSSRQWKQLKRLSFHRCGIINSGGLLHLATLRGITLHSLELKDRWSADDPIDCNMLFPLQELLTEPIGWMLRKLALKQLGTMGGVAENSFCDGLESHQQLYNFSCDEEITSAALAKSQRVVLGRTPPLPTY